AGQARREALDALLRRAEKLLEDAGHAAAPAVLRKINGTLDALAHRAATGPLRPLGTLAEDLDPPGLEVLAGLTAAPRADSSRPAHPSVTAAAPRTKGAPPPLGTERMKEGAPKPNARFELARLEGEAVRAR